jgi:scyllo-inositol 2-dehydrogenase (NADP+)
MPLRVGLIGYGLAGSAFHAPLIAAEPRLELAAVVTGNAERAARVATDHPGARVVGDADALWALAGELDVAVVAAPNRQHVPLALAALDAGLHVVVDKPVAPSAARARELRDAAAARGLLAVPFHNRRWDGDALTLRALLDADALGPVLRFESRLERWRPEVDLTRTRELADPDDAGGVLFDLGTHLIDQALWLFGPATVAHAELRVARPGAQVDDDTFVALEHASGVRSHLWASLITAQPSPRMRVLGQRAAWVKEGVDVQEAALRGGADPRDPGFGRDAPERYGLLGAADDVRPVETRPGRYLAFYAGLADAIRAGAPPPVSLDDAIAGLEIIAAARRG